MAIPAIALLASAFPLAGPDPVQNHLLDLVNGYRHAHGLEPLSLDTSLCKAATGHARFMAVNRVLTHFQTPGKDSFTGRDLEARARSIGWTDDCSELVGFANTGVEDSVQAIFDSPCHRVRFLRPGRLRLGAFAEDNYVCLLVGGGAAHKTVLSPPDKATHVPTTWFGASDFSGTKTLGGRKFGYPLAVVVPPQPAGQIRTVSAQLRDATGNSVPVTVRDPGNDPHYETELAVVPQRPLEPETSYRAHVVVKTPSGGTLVHDWTFSTGRS